MQERTKWKGYASLALMTFFVMMSYSLVGLILTSTGVYEVIIPSFGAIIIAMIMWGVGAALLLFFAHKRWGFNLFTESSRPSKKGIALCIMLVMLMTAIMTVLWGGFKPYMELQSHIEIFGNLGGLYFVLQIVYYCFEMLLALILVIFSQKALEIITKRKNVPWGGIVLGLTWGLVHILTQGDVAVGIVALVMGIFLGLPYLLLSRNAKPAWIFMVLIFI